MQAWDSVQVIETGEAGTVQHVDTEAKKVTVKLDLKDEPQVFDLDEIKRLS